MTITYEEIKNAMRKSYYSAVFLPDVVKVIHFTQEKCDDHHPTDTFHGIWTYDAVGNGGISYSSYGSEIGYCATLKQTTNGNAQKLVFTKNINGTLVEFERTREVSITKNSVKVYEDGLVVYSLERS